jgi:hypothetical protein
MRHIQKTDCQIRKFLASIRAMDTSHELDCIPWGAFETLLDCCETMIQESELGDLRKALLRPFQIPLHLS